MKVLVALSCLLAVAAAGYVSPYSYPYVTAYAQHVPVIGANGVPLDEPAVAHAKAEHAAAHIEAHARNGDAAVVAAPFAYANHYGYAGPVHSVYSGAVYSAYSGPQHLPVIGANGVPVDEPAVQVARANHAAAYVEAKVRNGDAAVVAPVVAPVVSHEVASVVAPVQVPADTPEVSAAKAAHFAAHVEAKARNGVYHYAPFVHYRKRRGIFATPVVYGAQHIPVIGANGVPVDEPAVQVARANHAVAYAEASARNGDVAVVAPVVSHAYAAHHVAAPIHTVYSGPQHLPVIGANGVPVDEPAVQVARANHAAAYVEAKVRNGDAGVVAAHVAAPVAYAAHHYGYAGGVHVPVIGANGVPLDEPSVAHAKAAHAAAHVEAKVRNGDLHHVYPVVHAY